MSSQGLEDEASNFRPCTIVLPKLNVVRHVANYPTRKMALFLPHHGGVITWRNTEEENTSGAHQLWKTVEPLEVRKLVTQVYLKYAKLNLTRKSNQPLLVF